MLDKILFVKKEEIKEIRFFHHPIWMASYEKEIKYGIIFEKTKIQQGTFHVDAETGKIIVFSKDSDFKLIDVVDPDPININGLSEACEWVELLPSEQEFSWGTLKKILSEEEVRKLINRKFDIKNSSIELVFFPLWEVSYENRKSGEGRIVIIDGVMGKHLEL